MGIFKITAQLIQDMTAFRFRNNCNSSCSGNSIRSSSSNSSSSSRSCSRSNYLNLGYTCLNQLLLIVCNRERLHYFILQ